jgi:hypothetical protein
MPEPALISLGGVVIIERRSLDLSSHFDSLLSLGEVINLAILCLTQHDQ